MAVNRQIEAIDKLVDRREDAIDQLSDQLEREAEFKANSLANDYEIVKKNLERETKARDNDAYALTENCNSIANYFDDIVLDDIKKGIAF